MKSKIVETQKSSRDRDCNPSATPLFDRFENRHSKMQSVKPSMSPEPGARMRRFVGDRVRFTLTDQFGRGPFEGWRALLRTNLGRAEVLRGEIIQAHARGMPRAGASWRDL